MNLKIQKFLPTKKEYEDAFNRLCTSLPDGAFVSLEVEVRRPGDYVGKRSKEFEVECTAYTNNPYSEAANADTLDGVVDSLLNKVKGDL